MKKTPDNLDPLLRAMLDDGVWREACEATRTRAGGYLRRRRLWRAVRGPLAATALAVGICWQANEWKDSPRPPSLPVLATRAPDSPPSLGPVELRLRFDFPPMPNAHSLTLCAYQPGPVRADMSLSLHRLNQPQ